MQQREGKTNSTAKGRYDGREKDTHWGCEGVLGAPEDAFLHAFQLNSDGTEKGWKKGPVVIRVFSAPFASGAMRKAYQAEVLVHLALLANSFLVTFLAVLFLFFPFLSLQPKYINNRLLILKRILYFISFRK